jgi:hypothetical protein
MIPETSRRHLRAMPGYKAAGDGAGHGGVLNLRVGAHPLGGRLYTWV